MNTRATFLAIVVAIAAMMLGSADSSSALPIAPSAVQPAADSLDIRIDVRRGGGGGRRSASVSRPRSISSTRIRNAHVTRVGIVGVRPVRRWVRRSYYGTAIGGVILGALIAAIVVPAAPGPDLCWYWSTPAQTQGYWDYCAPPQ